MVSSLSRLKNNNWTAFRIAGNILLGEASGVSQYDDLSIKLKDRIAQADRFLFI
jgi:hypothetical protein